MDIDNFQSYLPACHWHLGSGRSPFSWTLQHAGSQTGNWFGWQSFCVRPRYL